MGTGVARGDQIFVRGWPIAQMRYPYCKAARQWEWSEFALELAANEIRCERIDVKARMTTRKCVVSVHLFGVNEPLREPENEVLWRILKASAALAGGTAEISCCI